MNSKLLALEAKKRLQVEREREKAPESNRLGRREKETQQES
jgi:hypothetical protein